MEKKEVFVDISARHVHLTREDQDVLFGKGYELEVHKELAGGGGFASVEQIAVVGPRSTFPKVRILGPCRKQSQVELSKTDARALGVDAPVRLSGDLEGTPGIKLVGPAGELELKSGVIVAKRHIHIGRKHRNTNRRKSDTPMMMSGLIIGMLFMNMMACFFLPLRL